MRVRWTHVALADLVSARDNLAAYDLRAADELLRKVADALVYLVVASEIQVLRFWHSRRDPMGM